MMSAFQRAPRSRCLLSQHLTGSEGHTVCVCVRARMRLVMFDSATLWTEQPTGSSGHGISQSRMLFSSVQFSHSVVSDPEDTVVVTISNSRGSSRPRDRNHISWVSYAGKWILYHCATCRAQGSH